MMNGIKLLCVVLLALSAIGVDAAGSPEDRPEVTATGVTPPDPVDPVPEEPPADDLDPRVAALRQFEPLSIPHASWFLTRDLLRDSELLAEYVRITGVCTLSLLWSDDQAYVACGRAIDTAGRGMIAILYSPYNQQDADSAASFDAAWAAELLHVSQRLQHVKSLPQGELIQLALLDHEQYRHDEEPLVGAKLAVMYQIFHQHVLLVTWYGQGMIRRNVREENGWELFPKTLPSVPHDGLFGIALFELHNLTLTREVIRRSAAEADKHGADLAAWVCLGTGYAYEWDTGGDRVWRRDLTYPRANTWRFGFDLAHKYVSARPEVFAPYDRIKLVIFYPAPYGPANRFWHDHFLAYLHGWNRKPMEK